MIGEIKESKIWVLYTISIARGFSWQVTAGRRIYFGNIHQTGVRNNGTNHSLFSNLRYVYWLIFSCAMQRKEGINHPIVNDVFQLPLPVIRALPSPYCASPPPPTWPNVGTQIIRGGRVLQRRFMEGSPQRFKLLWSLIQSRIVDCMAARSG